MNGFILSAPQTWSNFSLCCRAFNEAAGQPICLITDLPLWHIISSLVLSAA